MHEKRNVLEYLEASACLRSDHSAVVDGATICTYAHLQHLSRKVGSALISRGFEGRPVVVLMEKSTQTLATMLGALYAGGYYIPVDPSVPKDRLCNLCRALGNPIVVFNEAAAHSVQCLPSSVDTVDSVQLFESAIDSGNLRAVRAKARDTDIAYVLFTSGSTGEPKGIAISHRAIIAFIESFVEAFSLDASDRFANQAPFDFDVSVKDIYGALAIGATLVLVPRTLFSAPVALLNYLEAQRVTVLIWAVAALCLFTSFHALDGRTLFYVRRVLFSGEVMPSRPLNQWLRAAPNARFANVYGPTEITCNCLYHPIDRSRNYESGIPLGQPFPHCRVILVDKDERPLIEPGVLGEIVVSGPSLACGYVGNSELTRCMFGPLRGAASDECFYRTGDLAVYSSEGELFYRGRRDNQIKRQGHRIELEEVDLAIERMDDVNRCRCVFDKQTKRLIAFYEGGAERADVLRQARHLLPAYMVPNKFVQVEHFPLNKNGKIDRKELCR